MKIEVVLESNEFLKFTLVGFCVIHEHFLEFLEAFDWIVNWCWWIVNINDKVSQTITSKSDSFFWGLMDQIYVLFSGNVGFHHEWISCVLSNQEWLFCPFSWVNVFGKFLDWFSISINERRGESFHFCDVLEIHRSNESIWIVLQSECTSIPERMEVLNSFVKNGEFKEVSSSISFGVSVVIKSNRVQWLMNISDHVDEISCEKCSFSGKFSKISFECVSCLLDSDDWGHGAFSVINDWYGGISDERTKFKIFITYQQSAIRSRYPYCTVCLWGHRARLQIRWRFWFYCHKDYW